MTALEELHALTEAARAGHTVTATDLAAARAQVDAEQTIDALAEEGRTERWLAAEHQAKLDAREAAKATVRAGITAAEARVTQARHDAAQALSDLVFVNEAYATKLLEYRKMLTDSGLESWNYYASMEQPPASDDFDPTIFVADTPGVRGVTVDGHPYEPLGVEELLNNLNIEVKDSLK